MTKQSLSQDFTLLLVYTTVKTWSLSQLSDHGPIFDSLTRSLPITNTSLLEYHKSSSMSRVLCLWCLSEVLSTTRERKGNYTNYQPTGLITRPVSMALVLWSVLNYNSFLQWRLHYLNGLCTNHIMVYTSTMLYC